MKMIAKGCLTTLAIGAVALSMAQTNGPKDFSIRAGGVWPQAGNSSLGFGVDWKLPQFGAPAARGVYTSYFGVSADWYGSGDQSNLPVAFTYNARANNLVFSGGAGIDWERFGGETKT